MWWKILLGLLAAIFLAFAYMLSQVNVTPGVLLHSLFGSGTETPTESTLKSRLSVPEGFTLGLYSPGVKNARFIEFSRQGDLLVAQPREGTITLLTRDANGDGRADGQRILMNNLTRPHSMDFFGSYLYVAESNAVGRIGFDHVTGETRGDYERIITGLGDEGNHWTKTIRFGPDGLLYLSSGSTCNVCVEVDPQRAAMTRYEPDGSNEQIIATGLRNSVGFDWSATNGALFATDNGRDLLGDDYPPCELNRIEPGNFYGWPYINGFGDLDPDFGDETRLVDATPPVHGFRAHTAPLGIRFIDIPTFPAGYRDAALVALHGSWNRSTHDGYSVVSLHRNADGSFEEREFLSGFESDGNIIGRPVDVAQGPDHCAYVSDDYSGAIYRVCYGIDQASFNVTANTGADNSTGLEGLDPARLEGLVSRGEQIYRTRGCTTCHVVGDKGVPFGMRPIKGIGEKYNVASLRDFFSTPTPPMPPVRLDSEEDALALSAYLLTLD